MSAGHRRLAVLGSPIAHSKSPALHRAAYGVLGLPWTYEAVEVQGADLGAFLRGLDASWRGLSLTMPLKRDVLELLTSRSPLVQRVGAANTVLLDDAGVHGFNTDVAGIVAAYREAGVASLDTVQVLGAGATAASVIAAVTELGARSVTVLARDPERAAGLQGVADAAGVELVVRRLGISDRSMIVPSTVVSTLPGGAADELPVLPEAVRQGAVLFDVAYDPWPSTLARSWGEVGGTVVGGLAMLLHQALAQVRIFVTGDETTPLDDEPAVLEAMRSSVALPT